MQNCDTRMTGEVHKRFHGQRRNWLLLQKLHSITSAVVACIVMYCETAPAQQVTSQDATVARNSEQLSRTAVITANPEHEASGRRQRADPTSS